MTSQRKAYSGVVAGLVGICLFVWATWLTTVGIVTRWMKFDESYSHGLLLLGVVCWMIWRILQREMPRLQPAWGGFLLLLPTVLLYHAAETVMVEAAQQVVWPAMVFFILYGLWGWKQAKAYIVPIGLLYFAIPVWDYLAWPLQVLTVIVNQAWLGLLGVEFTVDGVFVYLPNIGAFEVAHGCSGLRYLVVSMTLTTVYGFMNFERPMNRVKLFMLGVGFALLANWIRVCVIIYMGYITRMESSLMDDHESFGWMVFAATLIPVFLIANRMERSIPAVPQEKASQPEPETRQGSLSVVPAVMTLMSLLMPMVLNAWQASSAPSSVSPDIRFDQAALPQWVAYFDRSQVDWTPQFKGADHFIDRQFFDRTSLDAQGRPQRILLVRVRVYDEQHPGKELVQYGNRLYDNLRWRAMRVDGLADEASMPTSGLHLTTEASGAELLIRYGYYVAGRWETDATRAKLAQLNALFSGRDDASLVALGLWCREACEFDEQTLLATDVMIKTVLEGIDHRHAD
ncbi:MAG: exosortase [Gammaproteobacteria bacterium]|nr:exosortase [Gammaproteobacteria bacterium]